MSVKDELRDLIEQLDAKQAEVAADYVRRLLGESADDRDVTRVPLAARMQPLAAPARRFFAASSTSLADLARQQGVAPVPNGATLVGDFWPDDESVDEFVAAVRAWRHAGGHA